MIDSVVFAISLLVTLSLLASLAGYVAAAWVFPTKTESKIARSGILAASMQTVGTAIDAPVAAGTTALGYFATNVSAVLMLVLCVYISWNMTGSESIFLSDFDGTYKALKLTLFDGLLNPMLAAVNVVVTSLLPITNYATANFSILIQTTLKVLGSSAQDPFVIFRAFAALPNFVIELLKAWGKLVSQADGKSILENTFNLNPAIKVLQDDVFGVIADQADFSCRTVTPVVIVARNIMTSPQLRCTVDRFVNYFVHMVQGIVRLVHAEVDFKDAFAALRDAANCFGALLDEIMESFINLMALPALNFLEVKLPGPSLGSAIGRGLASFVSVVELIFSVVAEIRSFGSFKKLYIALDSTPFRREAHLAVLNSAAGLDHVMELMYSGTIGTKSYLRCEYWGYNFFADEKVLASIPQICICAGNSCGNHGTCVSTGICKCFAGYQNAIMGSLVSPCVPKCSRDKSDIRSCGPAFGNITKDTGSQSAGTCKSNGYCSCLTPAFYNLRTGKCEEDPLPINRYDPDPDQTPKASWADKDCSSLLTHQMDRPLPCSVQAGGLTILGVLVVGYEFVIDLIFNIDNAVSIIMRLPRLAQTYDGVWYPRFDSVSCAYRRDTAYTYDRTMLRDNCQCNPPRVAENTTANNYDPYCARPTLNANVYANMDRFAFYAGRNLPIKGVSQLQYVFVGGTGAQFGFLSDTIGAWASASARTTTEYWRVMTHAIVGLVTYVVSAAEAAVFRGRNLLQKPNNCDWGIKFDGPVRKKYAISTTEAFYGNITKAFEEWNPCAEGRYCTPQVQARRTDLIQAGLEWHPALMSRNVARLNAIHETRIIWKRNQETHDGHDTTCSRREYTSNAPFCETTNDSNECMCNPLLEPADKCLCIAFYPQQQAYRANMSGSYKSTFLARFYGSDMPWCHSMLTEWHNFDKMSTAVGLQNMWSRMAMGNPFASEIKSDCFDKTQTYDISPYSLLTRLFQPDPDGNGFIAVGNNMIPPRDLAICQALRRSKEIRWYKKRPDGIGVEFASHGRCFAKNHKEDECLEGGYDLRQLALTGFPNPYIEGEELICYQSAVFVGTVIFGVSIQNVVGKMQPPIPFDVVEQAIINDYGGNQSAFCADALSVPGKLTTLKGFSGYESKMNVGWINISKYKAALKGFTVGQGIALLHPITCGQVARSESLVFQPCRMSCETSSGTDMCWCKNIVHNDFRCNIANLQRELKWNEINVARRETTNRISILGMIPNGITIDRVIGMCDKNRLEGHKIAIAVGAILSPIVDGVWSSAADLRVKVARVLFNIYEYNSDVADTEKIARFGLYQNLVANAISSALGDTSNRCATGRNMCKACKIDRECYANPSDETYCYPDGECPTEKCCTNGEEDSLEYNVRIWIGQKVVYTRTDSNNKAMDYDATVTKVTKNEYDKVLYDAAIASGDTPEQAREAAKNDPTYDIVTDGGWRRYGVLSDKSADERIGVKRTKLKYVLGLIAKLHWYTPDCYSNVWMTRSTQIRAGTCYSKNYKCQSRGMCTPPKCAQERAGCSSVLSDAGKIWAQDQTIGWKQYFARECTKLQGLQMLMFDLGTSQIGAKIIPTIMKVIDIFAQVMMERVMTKAVLLVQIAGAFLNALTDPSGQAFLDFFKPLLTLILVLKTLLLQHAMKFIMLALDLTPAPLGPLVKAAAGTACKFGFSVIGWILDLLTSIPFVGAVFEGASMIKDLGSMCLTTGLNEADSPLLHEDYARRRLETRESQYVHFRNALDWNGTTVCAKYGRRDTPPENDFTYFHWQQCVANRIRVVVLRHAFQRDYFPWTLYDDYQQPLGFVMKVGHALFLHAAHSYAWLLENRKDLPADAAHDIVNMMHGMRLEMSPLQVVHDTVHKHYPHHVNDSSSIGFEVLRLIDDVRGVRVPEMGPLHHWHTLPGHLHRAVTGTLKAVHMSSGMHTDKHPRPHYAHRRLAENDDTEEGAAGGAPVQQDAGLSCPGGGLTCLADCELGNTFLKANIEISAATQEFYDNEYKSTVDYFVDIIKHFQFDNKDSPYATFPGIDMAYTPRPAVKVSSLPLHKLGIPASFGEQSWPQLFRRFFTVVDDSYIPVFQRSFWYYVRYPLRPCEYYKMNYVACKAPQYSVGDAITMTLRVMVGFWTIGFLTGLPLPFLIQIGLAGVMYMIFRYDWMPRCLPVVPPCVLTDLHAWIDGALPDCLCQMLPAKLIQNADMCTPAFCNMQGNPIIYDSCKARTLRQAWPILFLIRWQLPSLFQAALTSDYLPDLSAVEEIKDMLADVVNQNVPSAYDRACCTLQIFDVLLLLLALKFALVLLKPLSRSAIDLLVGNTGSLAVTLPYLLVDVPNMVSKESEERGGSVLKGWQGDDDMAKYYTKNMTLQDAVREYRRRLVTHKQRADFLIVKDPTQYVERAWREMGSPVNVKPGDIQRLLREQFEQPYRLLIDGNDSKEKVLKSVNNNKRLADYIMKAQASV